MSGISTQTQPEPRREGGGGEAFSYLYSTIFVLQSCYESYSTPIRACSMSHIHAAECCAYVFLVVLPRRSAFGLRFLCNGMMGKGTMRD